MGLAECDYFAEADLAADTHVPSKVGSGDASVVVDCGNVLGPADVGGFAPCLEVSASASLLAGPDLLVRGLIDLSSTNRWLDARLDSASTWSC